MDSANIDAVRKPAAPERDTQSSKADVNALVELCQADMAEINALITERMQSDVAVIPALAAHLIAAGGGSIICTSSSAGMKGKPLFGPYSAAKHGVTGLARSLANELAHHWIRVNTVHPTGVDTPMVAGLGPYAPGEEVDFGPLFQNALPVGMLESRDISNAVLFLASDEAKYITGLEFSVDAGAFIR